MIVALLALVVATSGSAFAAQAALIPGSRIQAHTITAKQLAKGAVNHAALANKAVQKNNYGTAMPKTLTGTICPNGTIAVGAPCSVGSYNGLLGGTSFTVLTIPAGGAIQTFFGVPSAGGAATLAPQDLITPDQPIQISHLSAEIGFNPLPAKFPTSITVGLAVNGLQTGTAFCTISNPDGTTAGDQCFQDPNAPATTVPAHSHLSFTIQVNGMGDIADPTWPTFELNIGYNSSVAG